MTEKITKYHLCNAKLFLRYMVVFSIMLFVFIKPVLTASNSLVETKYELFDFEASDSSDEKEKNSIDDNEFFFYLLVFSSGVCLEKSLSASVTQKSFLGVKPDIYLLPPRI